MFKTILLVILLCVILHVALLVIALLCIGRARMNMEDFHIYWLLPIVGPLLVLVCYVIDKLTGKP